MQDWGARLEPGERLLWQGRPVPPARPRLWMPFEPVQRWGLTALLGGLILALAGLIGPRLGGLAVPVLGPLVVPLAFGIWYANGGAAVWTRFWLVRTRYALTDRRALTATRLFGRDWRRAVPVASFTPPRLAPQGATGHVIYRSVTAWQGGGLRRQSHVAAFWYIPDARQVQALVAGLLAGR